MLISVCGEQDDGSGHQFSRHFKDVVKVCLQKDPTKRCVLLESSLRIARRNPTLTVTQFTACSPGTSALLKHSFFKKAGDSAYLAANLLSQIEDIGESSMTAGIADALPGFVGGSRTCM
jgi:serine/threonine-protein kinase OSR1/STK39